MIIKALTICQPHAWAIVHGPKRIENRRWYCHHKGPLAIHAGKSRLWLGDTELADRTPIPPDDQLAFGAVIGLAYLTRVVDEDLASIVERNGKALALDPFAEGPFYWLLNEDIWPLSNPVICSGHQGLWNWDTESVHPADVPGVAAWLRRNAG